MVTAEALTEGPTFQSAAARAFSLNLSRGDVDLVEISAMQKDKGMLSVAMAGYVRYLSPRYDGLATALPGRQRSLLDKLRGKLAGSHPRTPDNTAVLITTLRQFTEYTVSVGAMNKEEAREAYELCRVRQR